MQLVQQGKKHVDDEIGGIRRAGRIELVDKAVPDVGPNDALIRITTTTICGTDIHILKGEYPVAKGLSIDHEPVGVIEKLGNAVTGYTEGQRVIAGAICPNFNSYTAQNGVAMYISVELFTTLGLGDWVPQTLNAMLASGIEAILGFIQGGVFFAVLIYAHQDTPRGSSSTDTTRGDL
jgi:hypothetical protein